ncbi:putative oxidoreductase YjmC [Glandiceps talaboti]
MASEADSYRHVALSEVKSFVQRCIEATGAKREHASPLASVLMAADYRGHYSHGMNRLEIYVNDFQKGATVYDAEPTIVKETAATALVDGKNLLGPVIGKFCMELAIKKAKEAGIGWVVAHGSNHYGIAGWYSLMAVEQGLLGMSFTNSSPMVVPTRAKKGILGTNPISCAAPAKNGDSFVLDMATSSVACGRIELNDRKEIPIPNGWGVDSKGKETNDPKAVLDGGGLLPVGGSEESSGYKGYGLALMVEVLCGIMANGDFGPNIRKWKDTKGIANLGQCFVAIDPDAFAPGFPDRMQSLIDICRSQPPAEGETEVLVPGDPERQHMKKVDEEGGVRYHINLINAMEKLAADLKVKPMETK